MAARQQCSIGYCLNSVKRGCSFTQRETWEADGCDNPLSSRWRCFNVGVKQNCTFPFSILIIPKWANWLPVDKKMASPVILNVTFGEDDGILAGKEKEPYCLSLLSTSYTFLSPSQAGLSGARKRMRRKRALFSSSPTTSELPAGSELFYALVVTGRFIRLEICTNQLSFSGSCQCVKLSGPAVREMP